MTPTTHVFLSEILIKQYLSLNLKRYSHINDDLLIVLTSTFDVIFYFDLFYHKFWKGVINLFEYIKK